MDKGLQVLLLTIFVAMLGLGIVGPIMPIYAETFGANYIQIGLLSSAWSISRFLFSTPAGRLSDNTSKKLVIQGGLLVYSVVSLLYIFAADFNWLLIFRFIHGIGSAMASPIAMAYAAELAPVGQEGKYMGTMSLAMFLGMGIGPLIGGTLSDMFSLSAPFYVMCALTAISLLATTVFLPNERKVAAADRVKRPPIIDVLRNKTLLACFIYRAVNSMGISSIMGFLSIYMVNSFAGGGLGLSLTEAGTVLSVGQIAGALMQRPSGGLADKYNKNHLIMLGGVVSSVGMALFVYSSTFFHVMAARLVFALGTALISPSLASIAAIEGRRYGAGTTMSALESAMSLGMMVGPLMSGVLADMFTLKPIFWVGSGISFIGVIIYYMLLGRKALTDPNPVVLI
ncbi:MFS transporter [Candidatus Bathyarchaeota archaeon]|nr:MAG: MFS transporter [Candidatus Bathyarchaeota archaeon]